MAVRCLHIDRQLIPFFIQHRTVSRRIQGVDTRLHVEGSDIDRIGSVGESPQTHAAHRARPRHRNILYLVGGSHRVDVLEDAVGPANLQGLFVCGIVLLVQEGGTGQS